MRLFVNGVVFRNYHSDLNAVLYVSYECHFQEWFLAIKKESGFFTLTCSLTKMSKGNNYTGNTVVTIQ